ncbi:hypothetical protein DB88DRAFT_499855 [Papiliotrema laurentii]|uniref:Uncharacterized protein n=1 Tax=Papiliotrema laurentii TaxID=5418 RepID=A0AAD9FMP3_PAPLA|nr:hypothetical protein DB88DRAFT_499855 [Papiliotrema laurentii]
MDSFSLLSHPTAAPTGLAILLVLLALIYRTSTRTKAASLPADSQAPKSSTKSVESKGSGWLTVAPDGREWGRWIPSDFRMPPIPADHDFDLNTTQPPMYRAWKYKHTVVMDAKNMPWEKWIELDNQFPRYHALRKARIAERGKRLYGVLPGAEDAAREILLELSEFLSQRYPSVYKVTRRSGTQGSWFGEPNEICRIQIPALQADYDFDEIDDAMLIAGLIQPADLAIMMEGEDSLYYMKGGCIALAGSWRYEDKIGRDLYYIHTTGHVPEYREKLDLPMTRYHQRLRPETPGWRNNYTLTVDKGQDELAWSTSTNGPEDIYDQSAKGPNRDRLTEEFVLPERITDPTQVNVRQERQTLRRMPRTGAVLFTVHSYAEPVMAIASEPGVPGRLASAVKSWKGEVDTHKNGALYKDLLVPYLEELHKKQVAEGLAVDGVDPEWKYPY